MTIVVALFRTPSVTDTTDTSLFFHRRCQISVTPYSNVVIPNAPRTSSMWNDGYNIDMVDI